MVNWVVGPCLGLPRHALPLRPALLFERLIDYRPQLMHEPLSQAMQATGQKATGHQ